LVCLFVHSCLSNAIICFCCPVCFIWLLTHVLCVQQALNICWRQDCREQEEQYIFCRIVGRKNRINDIILLKTRL
jgi:hypothetical protein